MASSGSVAFGGSAARSGAPVYGRPAPRLQRGCGLRKRIKTPASDSLRLGACRELALDLRVALVERLALGLGQPPRHRGTRREEGDQGGPRVEPALRLGVQV